MRDDARRGPVRPVALLDRARDIKCFISYSAHGWQPRFAKLLAQRLERQRGIAVWIDVREIKTGDSLYRSLSAGLDRGSDCCVCLLSPNYLEGKIAMKEFLRAIALYDQKGKPLLPIMIMEMERPIELGDLKVNDFTHAVGVTGRVHRKRLNQEVHDLASDIRRHFEPPRDLLEFFDPCNGLPVIVATNRAYRTPYKERATSTTAQFERAVSKPLDHLQAYRKRISSWDFRQSEGLKSREVNELVDGRYNLVSYASGKINKCTQLMLKRMSREYRMHLSFVGPGGRRAGSTGSRSRGRRARMALEWGRQRLPYKRDVDHGIVARVRPGQLDKRVWWVFAGCGRPGSVAARRLVFDPQWSDVLWPAIGRAGKSTKGTCFIALFSVRYNKRCSDNPMEPTLVEVRGMTRKGKFEKIV